MQRGLKVLRGQSSAVNLALVARVPAHPFHVYLDVRHHATRARPQHGLLLADEPPFVRVLQQQGAEKQEAANEMKKKKTHATKWMGVGGTGKYVARSGRDVSRRLPPAPDVDV